MSLVYLPVGAGLATQLRAAEVAGPWHGFTASPGLRAQLAEAGADPGEDEVEYAALNVAGIAQLCDPDGADPRLVLAAEPTRSSDLDLVQPGSVTVAEIGWRQVTALFADEPEAAAAVSAARRVARGRSVLEALGLPEVAALTEGHDLLWYAPEELDQLLAGSS